MNNLKHVLGLRFLVLLNICFMTVPFAIVWFGYYASRLYSPFYFWGNWIVVGVFFALYAILEKVYEATKVSLYPISEVVYSQMLAAVIADFFLYCITVLLTKHIAAVLPFLAIFVGQIALSAIWSVAVHRWYFRVFPAKETAIIYDMREGMEQLVKEYGLEKKFHIRTISSVEECLSNLSMLDDVETVFLSGLHSHERNAIMKYCVYHGIDAYVLPRIGDLIMSSAKRIHLFHLPMLRVERYNPDPLYLLAKRVFDIVVSGLAFLVLSPIFLLTALAIKLDDGGPVFYKQERLTKDGKRFYIHKFRSMRVDAEKDGVARLSTGDQDDRITRVGHVIRKIRVDELPQLLDILVGHLSIVGPRPERPEIAAQYEEDLPEFALRLQVKAGLTGYAQVYGKYNTTPYDKLQMDLMYIANPSFLEDLRICFATVKILFMPESTEGIEEGSTTAIK